MRRFIGAAVASAAVALSAYADDAKPVVLEAAPAPCPAAASASVAWKYPEGQSLCGPACCGPCATGHCGWVSAEYLFWVVQGNPLPPLATTSPAGTPQTAAGVLGTPGAAVLFGGSRANDDFRSGLRVSGGWWLDDCQTVGIEGGFFFLDNTSDRFSAGSGGFPIVSRPFTSAVGGGTQASELVAFPGVLSGTVSARAGNRFLGASPTVRHNLCCTCDGRVDLIYGYRYLGLTDDVTINENLTATTNTVTTPAGTRILVRDHFRTENDFHGGVLGVAAEWRSGDWVIDGRASLALGRVRRVAFIDGSTTTTIPGGATVTRNGGLLTQGTNIGRYSDNAYSAVPEVGLKVGYQLTDGVRVFVGYNWLLWSEVWRAGDQIDPVVNPTQIPPGALVGPARPTFPRNETTVWAKGVSVGVQYRY